MRAVSRQKETEQQEHPFKNPPVIVSSPKTNEGSNDLLQLKKQLHHLEVESRVLLQENNK